jgi:AAA15 family ATPase/GTPase
MIQNLTIKNFKAHKSIEMKELANVNILLGKNNSGKTAILEALFLLSFPYTLNSLINMRGYTTGGESGEKWDSLFYNWDLSQEIYLEAKENNIEPAPVSDTKGKIRKAMSIKPMIVIKRPDPSSGIGVIEASDFIGITQGLMIAFTLPSGAIRKYTISDESEAGKSAIDDFKIEKNVVFVSARVITDPEKEAIRFSQLEIENRQNEVMNILRTLEPNLRRLFVGVTKKGSVIYGDIGIDHPIPLPLMGDGMLHALSIALAMVNSQDGLVLIDEIENGLHYSVLTDVWKMIFQTSQKLDVQVFVATHSDECIKAAYEAVESLKCYGSLKLYRFDRIKDGTRVEDYTANELYSAITSNQEVR